ncbi:MAG: hypothetical protein SCK28_07590 [Bacillota bacterium]|nr:hypothetical protein [Bacillota bacterium]
MEIKVVDKTSIESYLALCKEVYKNNSYYRDNMSTVLKNILTGKLQICTSSLIKPILVVDSERIVAACTFAVVDRMKDTLQIAFFEALENQEKAVAKIMDYGRSLAEEHGINKILIGLNFHVNYGLGLLADQYETLQSFGTAYNPPYYIDYFKGYANEEVNLVNYVGKIDKFDLCLDDRLINKLMTKYSVRKANFRNIKKEVEIYTYLNNRAFSQHKFYYERRLEEDLQLFNEFKLLLREENLLILEHEGNPIGFMLWYPDFNELLKPGEAIGLKTIIKSKFLAHKIKKFKIVEIGVLPEFQKKGAVLALFHKCRAIIQDRYEICESGWIMETNLDSRGFGFRWADIEYKHFKVFLVDLREAREYV